VSVAPTVRRRELRRQLGELLQALNIYESAADCFLKAGQDARAVSTIDDMMTVAREIQATKKEMAAELAKETKT
jgi:hypothetical protein